MLAALKRLDHLDRIAFEVKGRNPLITLLAVFTATHLAWLLPTEYAARRKRREQQTSKLEQSSTSS